MHQCYYWYSLHHPNTPVLSESDLAFLLSAWQEQNEEAGVSSRDISAALFLARSQATDISPDLLLRALVSLTLVEEHNPESWLVNELSLSLASLGPEARDAMYPLRRSGDEVVANAVVSALSVYGGEDMSEKIHDEISSIQDEFMKKFKAGESNLESDRFTQLSASNQLDYYFAAKKRQLEDGDLLDFIGRTDVITVSSTSMFRNVEAKGLYLSINLRNAYWLSRLDGTLSNASSLSERVQMEKIVRDAFNRNHPPENVSIYFRAMIYYLLGFELTEAEKKYLTDVMGLKESEFLPRGKIHIAGFNLDDFQRSDEEQLVATPKPEVSITPIAEVTGKEPSEKSVAVAPIADTSEEPAEDSSNWWLLLIGLMVVAGGLGLAIRSKS